MKTVHILFKQHENDPSETIIAISENKKTLEDLLVDGEAEQNEKNRLKEKYGELVDSWTSVNPIPSALKFDERKQWNNEFDKIQKQWMKENNVDSIAALLIRPEFDKDNYYIEEYKVI